MSRPVMTALLVAALPVGLLGPAHAAAFTFSTIDAPGATSTTLTGINASGQITGNTNSIAFVDDAGVFTPINVPGAMTQFARTVATGINNAGQITGRYPGRFGYMSFIDTKGSFTSGSAYASSNLDSVMPSGINDAGVLVGTTDTAFGGPGPPNSVVSFVGSSILTIPAAAGSTFFGLRGIDVAATGINDAGQVVGTFFNGSGNVGFLDAAGLITTITAPGAVAGTTDPTGINNLGEITETFQDAAGTHGFVDIGGVFTEFDVPGSLPGSTNAAAVNDLGAVVGFYSTALGVNGFLATPAGATTVPEPGSLALFGIGVMGLAAASRRRRPI